MSGRDGTETLRISTWTLEHVAAEVDGEIDSTRAAGRPAGISTDSRTIEPNELFVALTGERFDGHNFVPEVAEAGAIGAVVREDYNRREALADFPLIHVESPRTALAELGHAVWCSAREEGLHTIDVTGSNGKTTTKEFLGAVWATEGSVFATPGNYNNEIGLPLTLCDLPLETDHLVVELGANAPGEISDLVRLAPGDDRVVTSIGYDHLGGFGSIEGVREAKSEIFECSSAGELAVVPRRERSRLHLSGFSGSVWTFGEADDADLRLEKYRRIFDCGQRFVVDLTGGGRSWTFELPVPGRYNGRNLACALSTMVARGREPDVESVQNRLDAIDLPGGRWRRTRCGDICVVDDAYNANPTSVRASFSAFLDVQPDHTSDRRVAVLGEMRELGDGAEEWHGTVASEIAEENRLDAFCAVGRFAGVMAEAARTAGTDLEVCECEGPDAVASRLDAWSPAFVWMKASRADELERVTKRLRKRSADG